MISIRNFTIHLKSCLNFVSVMEEILINVKKNSVWLHQQILIDASFIHS